MYRRNRMMRTKMKQARAKLTGFHNQCPACGELFESIAAFDAHRIGPMHERHCLDTGAMRKAGLIRSAAGVWDIGPVLDVPVPEDQEAAA